MNILDTQPIEWINPFIYWWIAIAICLFPFILKFRAPYGRHTRTNWGPMISNRLGWILMEVPALGVFVICFLINGWNHLFINWLFFTLWVIHYTNRSLIFPFRIKTSGKKMPVVIVVMAFGFNLVNGFINGYYLGNLHAYTLNWLNHPLMILGLVLFLTGIAINWKSDSMLIRLRANGSQGYKVENSWLFKYISCPNLFGEIVEWGGFALMTWSLPGLAFFVWTLANLLPRALAHHRWYQENFDDYPQERKAVIPFIL
ncbi:MAG: DUF1295 domain-containing protein [Bacteroidetes bacterium]|nr:DUF1295 domain-containing protein [Bacteroidota bacterium]